MVSKETFTVDEILEILSELDVDVVHTSEPDNETASVTIECEIGPIDFFCNLHSQSPFFDLLSLRAIRFDVENCYVFVNKYNNNFPMSHAAVRTDDDGVALVDEDAEISVKAECFIHFAGGVTKEHVRYLLEIWIEELVDFYEIELQLDDLDDEIVIEIPQSPEFLEMTLLERISVFLSLNSAKTAREMGKILGFDRQEINRVLYKHRDRFVKNKSQPPQWNLKGNE
jgi:hypothetical protein